LADFRLLNIFFQEDTVNKKKIVIVGAGCAGLSAAYTLKKAGFDCTVFEAADVYGGRCRNVDDEDHGWRFFAGAGMTEPQWHTTAQYIEELGLATMSVQKKVYGFKKGNKIYKVMMGGDFKEYMKYLPDYISFFLHVWPYRIYWQLLKVFNAMKPYMKNLDASNHNFEVLREVSNISTADFVCKHGGWEAVNWFFHPFLATMVLARPQEISAAHPMSLFALMKGMSVIVGGMGELTEGLYQQVKESVHLNTPVTKIVIKDNKVLGVETKNGFVEADYVICAVDAVVARAIMPDLPDAMRRPLEKCGYSSTIGYHIVADKPIKIDPSMMAVMIPQDEKTIFSTIFHMPSEPTPTLIFFTRGWMHDEIVRLSEEERFTMVVREAQKYFPDFTADSKFYRAFRWDRAVNLEGPGQFEAIQDLLQHHMDDVEGLQLAGEYLFLIACTEGALMTGKQAAEKIISLS
jgi:protoporphyrinogen/coproporphyrinogen III oxidase